MTRPEVIPFDERGVSYTWTRNRGSANEENGTSWKRRGEAKGISYRWKVERLILPPRRKRRARERLEISYCPEGWYSDSGGIETPGPQAMCSAFLTTMTSTEGAWTTQRMGRDEAHRDCKVVWRIVQSGPAHAGVVTHWYCSQAMPAEYLEFAPLTITDEPS